MKNLPSVLLIDGKTEFQEAFAESLKAETKKKLFQLELASSGKQGLAIINNNNKQGIKTFAFIDIILPDIQGDKLVEEIEKSTLIFQSVFQDLDLVTLRSIVQRSIELCTESGEEILFSFLPYPEMLVFADNLKCRCLIVEAHLKQYQDVVTFWKSLHSHS